ncbi:unnamed protein product [Rotaria sp. Silwood1]|nr:unnamed protein product [Rotaria sp. Silwood1]CAF5025101.1 unnamed protein product [Rotaria sp. Silwood1]
MEKSLEQLKHIERISRQTRRHRTHLNHICDQNLRIKLNDLNNEREQSIIRSTSRRQLEEERKQLVNITIKQIARERQQEPLRINTIQIEQETIEKFSKDDESRPSSSIKLPSTGRSCHLFSHNCQFYPCQPIYEYTSFVKKENDQTLRKRNLSRRNSIQSSHTPHIKNILTTIHEREHQQYRRQLELVMQNQHHLAHRHVSMQRTMSTLDEQSRLLHEQLTNKKTFGYNKERQHQLSKAIQNHLKVTAKFCA